MGRTFVIGDIHGAFRALAQCLQRSRFDRDTDTLVCLGDVCDGWPETSRCIDELLRIRNLIYVMGNHDTWLLKWMKTGDVDNMWYVQGGEATIMSYGGKAVPAEHVQLLEGAKPWVLLDGKLFVHAGILPHRLLEVQTNDVFLWDRSLAKLALKQIREEVSDKITIYDEVYIGHTPTSFDTPRKGGEVWLMDTGAGWSGRLSIMEIESKEYFTSDTVPSLYPGAQGRSRG